MRKSKSHSENFRRAKDMVLSDKFDFAVEGFSKQLSDFLSDYFVYDSLTVDAVEGKSNNLVLCINVHNVKNSRTL